MANSLSLEIKCISAVDDHLVATAIAKIEWIQYEPHGLVGPKILMINL